MEWEVGRIDGRQKPEDRGIVRKGDCEDARCCIYLNRCCTPYSGRPQIDDAALD